MMIAHIYNILNATGDARVVLLDLFINPHAK